MRKPKVYLIILNWNGYKDTCECLDSLQNISFKDLQIVVVDNASSDNSLDNIETWAKQNSFETVRLDRRSALNLSEALYTRMHASDPRRTIVLIQSGKNLGFAGGNNLGIRFALQMNAEYIWLLNNDTVVNAGCLEALLGAMYIDDRVGFVGSQVLYYNQPNVIQTTGMWLGSHNLRIIHLNQDKSDTENYVSRPLVVDCVPACSMLIRGGLIRDVGLMDEDYFMYHEDIDWQIRASKRGWIAVYAPGSKILHKCGKSTQKSKFVAAYYQSRNKFLLIAKNNNKLTTRLIMVPLVFALLRNLFRALFTGDWACAWGIWQGGKDFFLGHLGYRNFEHRIKKI